MFEFGSIIRNMNTRSAPWLLVMLAVLVAGNILLAMHSMGSLRFGLELRTRETLQGGETPVPEDMASLRREEASPPPRIDSNVQESQRRELPSVAFKRTEPGRQEPPASEPGGTQDQEKEPPVQDGSREEVNQKTQDDETDNVAKSRLMTRPEKVAPAQPVPKTSLDGNVQFADVLFEAASADGTVIVGVGDRGFLSMLQNFIETSIVPFDITNFLVVAMDSTMCKDIASFAENIVQCFYYPDGDRLRGGKFESPEFARMVNIKTEVVLAATKLGYDTLLVDGDIVFLKDPQPYLEAPADVHIQDDAEAGKNSGFMLVRATPWGVAFIGESLRIAMRSPRMRQHPAVNSALKNMERSPLVVQVLDLGKFPNGKKYFERPRRMFAYENPCDECVIVHNNWIVGTVAKVFRFQENLLWLADSPKGYYTSETTKYLEFGNPDPGASLAQERQALVAAFQLAALLGRVVILPPFRCHGCTVYGLGGTREGCSGGDSDADECMITAHFSIETLRARMGEMSFRERMFRYNPLVPSDIRLEMLSADKATGPARLVPGPEEPFVVFPLSQQLRTAKPERVFRPRAVSAVTEEEVRTFVAPFAGERVIRFHSLYGVGLHPGGKTAAVTKAKLDRALKRSTLRQY